MHMLRSCGGAGQLTQATVRLWETFWRSSSAQLAWAGGAIMLVPGAIVLGPCHCALLTS